LEAGGLGTLTCAQVFEAAGEADHPRMALQAGYQELLGQAEMISNLEWREAYLQNIPEHSQITELWRKTGG
jgi:hypothetical protein